MTPFRSLCSAIALVAAAAPAFAQPARAPLPQPPTVVAPTLPPPAAPARPVLPAPTAVSPIAPLPPMEDAPFTVITPIAQTPPPGEPAQTPRPRPGQTPPAPTVAPVAVPPQPPQPAVALPPRAGQAVNIQIELGISDEGGTTPPVKKIVSMTVADGSFGQIRSNANVAGIGDVPLNVDARPLLMSDGKMRVDLTINYNLTEGSAVRAGVRENQMAAWKTEVREQLSVILENGKPLIVSRSADPIGDRRVTVEVKATVQR